MNKEKQSLHNKRAYAKKQGLTLEEYEAKQAEKMRARAEKKKRIYKKRIRNKKTSKVLNAQGGFTEAQLARFKEKHRQWEGTRLEKSLNKVVLLTRFEN